VFPVRYELNIYINLLRNSVFKGLKACLDVSLDRSGEEYGSQRKVLVRKSMSNSQGVLHDFDVSEGAPPSP
jgi:hypothetical protein